MFVTCNILYLPKDSGGFQSLIGLCDVCDPLIGA